MTRSRADLGEKQRWMRQRHAPDRVDADAELRDAGVYVFEPHYSIADLAEQWNLSRDAVQRMFEDEPGVLLLGAAPRPGKRPYRTFRIPKSVAERVYRRNLTR